MLFLKKMMSKFPDFEDFEKKHSLSVRTATIWERHKNLEQEMLVLQRNFLTSGKGSPLYFQAAFAIIDKSVEIMAAYTFAVKRLVEIDEKLQKLERRDL